MIRFRAALLVLLLLPACGGEESTDTVPSPAATTVPSTLGPFALQARCGVPDRAPPVLFTGDATGVVITVHRTDDLASLSGLTVHTGAAKRNDWYFLPPLPSGLYRVRARRSPDDPGAVCRLVVSDLAVVVTRSRREALVFVADARTGRPVPSATVKLRAGDTEREGDTDSLGVCRADVPAAPVLEVLVTKKDRVGYAETAALPGGDIVAWFGFDRPAYAPGDEVRVAGVYRARNGDYRAADLRGLLLTIRDERESIVAAAEPTEREPGFFHGAVRIPPDPPPGPLWLVAGAAGRRRIVLAPPEGTGVGLLVDAPETTVPGEELTFRIQALGAAPVSVTYALEHRNRGLVRMALSGRVRFEGDRERDVRFTPEEPGELTLDVRWADGNGREVVRRTTVRCGSPEPPAAEAAPRDIRVLAEPAEVEPGGRIRVTVDLPPNLADATVLTLAESGTILPHAVETIGGTRLTYEIEAPDRPGRSVRLSALAVRGRRVHRAAAVVRIRVGDRRLPVTLAVAPSWPPGSITITSPADGRAVIAIHEDTGCGPGAALEDVFYGPGGETFTESDSLGFSSRSGDPSAGGTGPAPDPPSGEIVPRPGFWRADVRLEGGQALVPVDLPTGLRRLRVVVTVFADDHRFGSATQVLRLLGPPTKEDPEPTTPAEAEAVGRATFYAGALDPGLTSEGFPVPRDARAARITIHVTRGPLGAVLRSLPTEETASTATSDEALAAFVPAAVARSVAADEADRAGFTAEVVMRLVWRATARLYARQAREGGFSHRDGAQADPYLTARVIRGLVRAREAGMPIAGDRIDRAADWLAHLDAKSRGSPPAMTPAEKAAIALSGVLSEPGATVDEGVRGVVRKLLDARRGRAWGDPKTTVAAALALLTVRRLAGPGAGNPLPLRIRVGPELVAAVTLSPENLTAGGRAFEAAPDALPRGRINITFEAPRDPRADVAIRLFWVGSRTGND